MSWNDFKKKIVYNKKMVRSDITPIFEDSHLFNKLIRDLSSQFKTEEFDKVVCLDALGFVIGSAIAFKLNKPLILIRKSGKFPNNKEELESINFIDYNKEESFEIKKNSLKKEDRVLLVDEWIDTGAQIKAAIELIEKFSAKIVGITTIYLNLNKETEKLSENYRIKYLKASK